MANSARRSVVPLHHRQRWTVVDFATTDDCWCWLGVVVPADVTVIVVVVVVDYDVVAAAEVDDDNKPLFVEHESRRMSKCVQFDAEIENMVNMYWRIELFKTFKTTKCENRNSFFKKRFISTKY